jgi:hypothetical protein
VKSCLYVKESECHILIGIKVPVPQRKQIYENYEILNAISVEYEINKNRTGLDMIKEESL